MVLLRVAGIVKRYGPEPVLDGVTFDVRAGQRMALVGPNGTGKTTLLRMLAGCETPDEGLVELAGGVRLGYLEQHARFVDPGTVWEEARRGLEDLIALGQEAEQVAAALAVASDPEDQQRLTDRYDRLQRLIEHHDAYEIDFRIERVLDGLGFPRATFQQHVSQLSGGQQNRLLLARLLIEEPDLLLLDEPSNHLDIDATEWLEQQLCQSRQAWIIVSHDRYLLDRVTDVTLELLHGTVDAYPGSWTKYQQLKAERLEVERRTFERQRQEIARMEEFVRRHHAGQKHAQAEDRRKKLERIERVEPPRSIEVPPMKLPRVARSGDIVLRAEHLAKAFQQPLFQRLSFDILRGDKWGILGRNGAGKTTLLRCLLGLEPLDDGRVTIGTGVQPAYFDQQLQCVADELPVIEAVRPDEREFPEQQRRDLLARFGIRGEMVYQRVGSLSDGERNRIALARLAASDANFLLLDEPTNHLDLWAREALEQALREFPGTVLLVSHDRYLLNRVVDHLLIVEPDRFRVVPGTYEDYLQLVRAGLARSTSAPLKSSSDGERSAEKRTSSEPRPANKPRRQWKYPYRKPQELENEIHECELLIEQLHEQLLDPNVLRNGDLVRRTKADLQQHEQRLVSLYEHWEEATERHAR